MGIDTEKKQKHTQDIFDNNFEVIYEGELPELPNDLGNDDYKDVLSNLSELDTTNSLGIDYLEQNRTKTFQYHKNNRRSRHRAASQSPRHRQDAFSLTLQITALLLIIAITGLLAISFWNYNASHADINATVSGHNYILGAYYGTAFFLLLTEWITFLNMLLNNSSEKGGGIVSFLMIYFGSLLSRQFAALIPSSPLLLLGIKEALTVYGALYRTLFLLCGAGTTICIIRKMYIMREFKN